jgi:sensor histidine kinase regulating citrate/malate metabolism
VTWIQFTAEKSPGELRIICEDNGTGVPADAKEKIFQRKYYLHTGLGLFLAQETLSITGLSIRETGTFHEGARFEIIVPKAAFR